MNFYLGLITAILVFLVARIWENIWKSGCLEVKCGLSHDHDVER